MARTTSHQPLLSVELFDELLSLDGSQLLARIAQSIHQRSQSALTSIVELDQGNYRATVLASATHHDELVATQGYELSDGPCSRTIKREQDVVILARGLAQQFPNLPMLSELQVKSYIGVPLRSASGETLGILYSMYHHDIDDETIGGQALELVRIHRLLANLCIQHLRTKWLAQRSSGLVKQLNFEMSHDSLTGLSNRSSLSETLHQLTHLHSQPFTLAYLDIDNFKHINDLYGMYIGDQIIKFVANAIAHSIRQQQCAFRIAGDEFAFVIFSDDPIQVCESILERIERGYQDPNHTIKLKVSIGIAQNPGQKLTADQLILNATLALKDCKQSRRTQIQCYDTHLSAQYYRRTMVIDALRNELTKESSRHSEISIALQPIVKQGQTHWDYFEVLARWTSHTLGIIPPMEFIEAAEQSGLIVELGERILEQACEAKKVLEAGIGHKVRLSINCSAHEIAQPERYVTHLLQTLTQFGYLPNEFTIELTETVLLSRTQNVRQVLDELRMLGFTISLDDFGTGYSSLNYIHSYPIDGIKIDASFVRNILTNPITERVVSLIVELSKQLEVSLVAEGVETEQALNKLYQMGCTQIQGYYFARPEPVEAMISLCLKVQAAADDHTHSRRSLG